MLGLMKKIIIAACKLQAKPVVGVVGIIGAAYTGVIDPETAKAICVAVYTAWVTMK